MSTNLATQNYDAPTPPTLPAGLTVVSGTFVTSAAQSVSSPNSLAFAPSAGSVEGEVNFTGVSNSHPDQLSATRYIKFGTLTTVHSQSFKVLLSDVDGYNGGGGYVGILLSRDNGIEDMHKVAVYASTGTVVIHADATKSMLPTTPFYRVRVQKVGTHIKFEVQRKDNDQYLSSAGTWGATPVYCHDVDLGTDVPDVVRVQTLFYNNVDSGSGAGTMYSDDWSDDDLYVAPATSYSITLPSPAESAVGVASGNITVTPNGTSTGTTVITLTDGGNGGTFTPSTLTWGDGEYDAKTATYTPASAGTIPIAATNDGGLSNPASQNFLAYTVATGFSISGPSSGTSGVPSSAFTVSPYPSGSRVVGTVVFTITDESDGGTASPTTLSWSDEVGGKTFTYTAGSDGTRDITGTNNGGLSVPASPVAYTSTTSAATAYTLTAPTPAAGTVGVASGNFTLQPNGSYSGTITLSDGGAGGTFTPSSLTWTAETGAKTCTYTPASAGVKTITASDTGGLTDPAAVTYTANDPAAVGGLNIEVATGLNVSATIKRRSDGYVYDQTNPGATPDDRFIAPAATLSTYGIDLVEVVPGYYAAVEPAFSPGAYDVTYYNSDTGQPIGYGVLDTRTLGGLSSDQATALAAIKAKTDNLPASPAATGDAMALTAGERANLRGYVLDGTTITYPEGASGTITLSNGQVTSITPDEG